MSNKIESIFHYRIIEDDEDLIIKPCNNNLVEVKIFKRNVKHKPFNELLHVLAIDVVIEIKDSKTVANILELREVDE